MSSNPSVGMMSVLTEDANRPVTLAALVPIPQSG